MNIFVDSSIIIEVFKGNNEALQVIDGIKKQDSLFVHINPIVVSEVSYFLLKKTRIPVEEIKDLLTEYNLLNIDKDICDKAFVYMDKYQLFPNDSLILATCKYYGIEALLSLDADFIKCCSQEKIKLINHPQSTL